MTARRSTGAIRKVRFIPIALLISTGLYASDIPEVEVSISKTSDSGGSRSIEQISFNLTVGVYENCTPEYLLESFFQNCGPCADGQYFIIGKDLLPKEPRINCRLIEGKDVKHELLRKLGNILDLSIRLKTVDLPCWTVSDPTNGIPQTWKRRRDPETGDVIAGGRPAYCQLHSAMYRARDKIIVRNRLSKKGRRTMFLYTVPGINKTNAPTAIIEYMGLTIDKTPTPTECVVITNKINVFYLR